MSCTHTNKINCYEWGGNDNLHDYPKCLNCLLRDYGNNPSYIDTNEIMKEYLKLLNEYENLKRLYEEKLINN